MKSSLVALLLVSFAVAGVLGQEGAPVCDLCCTDECEPVCGYEPETCGVQLFQNQCFLDLWNCEQCTNFCPVCIEVCQSHGITE